MAKKASNIHCHFVFSGPISLVGYIFYYVQLPTKDSGVW